MNINIINIKLKIIMIGIVGKTIFLLLFFTILIINNINNYNLPTDSYSFIPFAWTTDYPIVAIGIKGNGNVYIGHSFVETIK